MNKECFVDNLGVFVHILIEKSHQARFMDSKAFSRVHRKVQDRPLVMVLIMTAENKEISQSDHTSIRCVSKERPLLHSQPSDVCPTRR